MFGKEIYSKEPAIMEVSISENLFSGGGKSVARQRAISVCLTSSVPTHFFLRATQDHLCQHIATWGGMALISRTLPSSMNFTNVKDLV